MFKYEKEYNDYDCELTVQDLKCGDVYITPDDKDGKYPSMVLSFDDEQAHEALMNSWGCTDLPPEDRVLVLWLSDNSFCWTSKYEKVYKVLKHKHVLSM